MKNKDLPRPDISITQTGEGRTDIVISRDGKGKSYSSEQPAGSQEVIRELVKKIIDDPYTGEWLPHE